MTAGDITATDEGTFVVGSSEMLSELDGLAVGGATAGTELATIYIVSNGIGQATIYKLLRSAA